MIGTKARHTDKSLEPSPFVLVKCIKGTTSTFAFGKFDSNLFPPSTILDNHNHYSDMENLANAIAMTPRGTFVATLAIHPQRLEGWGNITLDKITHADLEELKQLLRVRGREDIVFSGLDKAEP